MRLIWHICAIVVAAVICVLMVQQAVRWLYYSRRIFFMPLGEELDLPWEN